MSAVENINPEKAPIPAAWVPRLITGGKGPPEDPPVKDNWLIRLQTGTVFCCRANDKTVDWEEYALIGRPSMDLFYLKVSMPDGNIWTRRVDPKLFCNHHREYFVLFVQQQEQQEPEENNDCGECNPL